jgi:AraC-like DNA-binding protein
LTEEHFLFHKFCQFVHNIRMRAHFEKLPGGTALFSAFARVAPQFPFFWHYHPEYELTLIVNSHGQRLVGDGIADYVPGDLVLLGPGLPHSWRSRQFADDARKQHRAVVVHFRQDFLGERFFALKEMAQVSRLLDRAAYGLAFGHTSKGRSAARTLTELPSQPPARRLLSLLWILLELADESKAQRLSTIRLRPICRVEDQRRIEKICHYLEGHFDQRTNFAELTRHVYMDQTSLCRFFKRATGRTMSTYVNELRLGAASELLTNTDMSILEIAFRVGFENYSNFCRRFKRMKGCTPRTLRKQFRPVAQDTMDSPRLHSH